MSEVDTRLEALRLANAAGQSPLEVVARAAAYHTFLSGAVPAPGTALNGAAAAGKTASTAAAGKTAAGAAGGKTASTAAAGKTAAAGAKAGAKAGAAQSTANDAKAPGGTYTYGDVVNALRDVLNKVSREAATKVLTENGNGVTSVRELKPEFFDAVVEGARAEMSGEGDEDPTAGPPADDLLG